MRTHLFSPMQAVLCAASFLLWGGGVNAQSVSINPPITGPLLPFVQHPFTISINNLAPTDTITKIEVEVVNSKNYFIFYNNNSPGEKQKLVIDAPSGGSLPSQIHITVRWGDPNNAYINTFKDGMKSFSLKATYIINNVPVSKDATISKILGLNDKQAITGPKTIQKCCLREVEYQVNHTGDADWFQWEVTPASWVVNPNNPTSQKTAMIKPDNTSNGVVKVTSRLLGIPSQAFQTYKVESSYLVTRTAPQFQTPPGNLPAVVCKGFLATFTLHPICGATHYTWNLPPGWTIRDDRDNGRQITVMIPDEPTQQGPLYIFITAHFAQGCGSVTYSHQVTVRDTKPDQPEPLENGPDYTYFHCGNWRFCDYGGYVSIEPLFMPLNKSAQIYHYEIISGNWTLENGVTYVEKAAENHPQHLTASSVFVKPAHHYSGPCTLKIWGSNCIGIGEPVYVTLMNELSEWCPGTPQFIQQYPGWCACCTPPPPGGPLYPLRPLSNQEFAQQQNIQIFSNASYITIKSDEPIRQIQLLDIHGRVLKDYTPNVTESHIDWPPVAKGIYIVKVLTDNAIKSQKLIKNE